MTRKTVFAVLLLVGIATRVPSGVSTDLAVAGRTNGFPSVAASGKFVAIVWGAAPPEAAPDIYSAVSIDGGRTFAAPVRVNETPANLSGEQPPRLVLLPRSGLAPSIVIAWTSRADGATRLMTARSNDGGKTFARAVVVPGSEAAGNRGWESIAADPDGHVLALWLDHRELAPPPGASQARGSATASPQSGSAPHSGHQHGASPAQQRDGVARAQLSKLFFARLDQRDSARALTGGVCYCCKTAMTTGSGRDVYAAWRHVYPGNVRDIAFAMSRDGGRTFAPPVRVSDDRWVLDGCPENGPAIAVDDRGRIHVAWPTLVPGATPGSEPTLAVFYAMSRDGRQFTPRQRVPTEGFPRHPQLAVTASGEVLVVWDEEASGTRRVALGRGSVDDSRATRFTRHALGAGQLGSYPVIAATDSGAVVAWTSGQSGQTVLRVEYQPLVR